MKDTGRSAAMMDMNCEYKYDYEYRYAMYSGRDSDISTAFF